MPGNESAVVGHSYNVVDAKHIATLLSNTNHKTSFSNS